MRGDDVLAQFSTILDGEGMTGRQAVLIVFVWLGVTAIFGLISYIIVFILMGY